MSNMIEKFNERCGDFHTQANLAQALLDIMIHHHNQVHGNEQPIPSFLKMTLSNLCNNLSCIVNGNKYAIDTWQQMEAQVQVIMHTIENAKTNEATNTSQTKDGENNGNA